MKFAEVQAGVPYPEKKITLTEEAVKAYLAAVEDDTPLYKEEQLVPPAYAAVYTRWEALTGEQLEDGTVHAKQGFRYENPGKVVTVIEVLGGAAWARVLDSSSGGKNWAGFSK